MLRHVLARLVRFAPHAWLAVVGTLVAAQIQSSPFGNRPIVDERMYVEWARRIAGGELLGNDVFFFDPLWAYVLGGLFTLTHGSLFAARLFQIALGVGTVELVFRTADALASRRTAYVAAAMLALYGPFVFASGFLLKEPLTIHGVAWVAFLLGLEPTRRRSFALGLTLGLLALLRGNFLVIALPLVLWRKPRALAVAGLALPLSLSLAHNVAAGDQWILTTAHGGANFWLGNNPSSSGTYEAPPFIEARPASELSGFKAEAERRVGHPLTQAESSRYWFLEGLRFWGEQPLDALVLTFKKLRLLLSDYEVPDNYAFTCVRSYFAFALWLAPLGWGALLGLALLGAWQLRKERRAWPLLLLFGLYSASVVAFFVFDRYRVPLAPLLCLFAAHGLFALRCARVGWLVAGTAIAFIPTPVSIHRTQHEAQCVETAGLELAHDQDPAAQHWLDEAARLKASTLSDPAHHVE
jgi:4-amino-4-deoxy-L-arabinose transferase-like glycosyltransferase